jgi:hypothetical protein
VRDATTGSILNQYPVATSILEPAPETTWAINLTDTSRQFRLLGFDFDADRGDAAKDAHRFRTLLDEFQIPSVLCQSGPLGGRHVWIGPEHPLPAEFVRDIATAASHLYPTLDTAPLLNAVTGALRPPLAPHRSERGAVSTVLSGDLSELLNPRVWTDQLEAFATRLDSLSQPVRSQIHDGLSEHMPLPTAEDGHPWLPKERPTALSSRMKRFSMQKPADPSLAAWTLLCAAANAGWTMSQVHERLLQTPGMEHLRTMRTGYSSHRPDRPRFGSQSTRSRLAYLWTRAVRWVTWEAPDVAPDSNTARLAQTLQAHWERALARPGHWSHGAGPAAFRVLTGFLCLCATARTDTIDIDVRRMADLVGISRQTAAQALHRLRDEGILRLVTPSEGTNAATWGLLSTGQENALTQVLTPPRIEDLLSTLGGYCATWQHDALTAHGTGLAAGNLYAACLAQGTDLPADSPLTADLQCAGLTQKHRRLRVRSLRALRSCAVRLGVAGTLALQRVRHAAERLVWRWLQREISWLRALKPQKWKRPPLLSERQNPSLWPRFPRRDGALDLAGALEQVKLHLLSA